MRASAVCLGFILDAVFGDPHWLWHPICAIGSLIAKAERIVRRLFPKTAKGEHAAGVLLWCVVCFLSFAVPFVILWISGMVHPALQYVLEVLFCYQIFARRSLRDESLKVYARLAEGDLDGARLAVSYIVGRDTAALTETGVVKAAVETVAENASDGVIAPMLFLLIGGAPLGFFYKAVNTLDSMVGYKNEKYLNLGRFSARMDDLFNWIPARLSAFCMILGARLVGFDGKNALRIWKRDRRRHASPNSAQTESACAGALHIQLAGDASYFGKVYQKPTIGDFDRAVEAEDIDRANRLMTVASVIALLLLLVAAFIMELLIY
ncbi:adenosylcobinamide-phosphate synthase CbiB [Intestinibacillus massiliensis]|uniref:adenosylcobinamide-phosphate synthase CbiB n=1 Tax=Intestinibacillus massiliensis TaxID=1871029 RepID=UPI000B3597DF|nr:adenosylcobinamide-phosphate synthase CbiB [Intestinibacillus massiliensis]